MLASNNPFREVAETQAQECLSLNPDWQMETPKRDSREETLQGALALETPSEANEFITYILVHSNFRRHFKISLASSPDALFCVKRTSSFTTEPDVVLYAGEDDKAPIIGVAKLDGMYKRHKVGLGDPDVEVGPGRIKWEDLRRLKKWSHSTHGFEWGDYGDRKRYEWRRLKDGTLDINPETVLVEDGRGSWRRVSVRRKFWPGLQKAKVSSLKMRMSLEIRKGGGEEWQKIALLTGVTMLEKSRRRAGKRKYT